MQAQRVIGRYAIHGEIASGGMATVHLARLRGSVGFARTVAIKQLHPQLAKDPDFVAMIVDEARLAARIRHPNVVATLDVVSEDEQPYLVMEYVLGETLSRLARDVGRRGERMPIGIVVAIMHGVLQGLHAAHEATADDGTPLEIVHRDVSPQNVIVGIDGGARVLDFGVAKAAERLQTTRDGQLKGKTSYMAPEQLRGRDVDRRADVFAAGIVLWEALVGDRLFRGESPGETMARIIDMPIPAPSTRRDDVPAALDEVVLRALDRDVGRRFQTALEMAIALERAHSPMPTTREVGAFVSQVSENVQERAKQLRDVESGASSVAPPAPPARDNDPSGVAVSSEVRQRRLSRWVGGVSLVFLAAGGALTWKLTRPEPRATMTTRVDDSASVATSTTGVAPAPAASSAPRVATSAPSAASTVSRVVAPVRRPKRDRVSCNPPYTVDAEGVHIPKPECE